MPLHHPVPSFFKCFESPSSGDGNIGISIPHGKPGPFKQGQIRCLRFPCCVHKDILWQGCESGNGFLRLHIRNVERVYHKFMHMSSCPARGLHVAAAFEGAPERAFVGIFQVAADGQAASKAGDANAAGR